MPFLEWLSKEAKGFAVLGYIAITALFCVSLNKVLTAAMVGWGVVDLPVDGIDPLLKYFNWRIATEMFVFAPVMEEFVFRAVPLSLAIMLISRRPWGSSGYGALIALGVAFKSTIVFAAVHPYALHGRIGVAIYGMALGMVFIKCGGMERNFLRATAAAIGTHSAINIGIVLYAWWEQSTLLL